MHAASRATLCNLVEDHLTTLVREASTVQRHSRRARFRLAASAPASTAAGPGGVAADGGRAASAAAGDAGAASAAAAAAAPPPPKRRRLLHADDINLALAWRGSEKLYLTNAGGLPGAVVSSASSSAEGGTGGGDSGGGKRQTGSPSADGTNNLLGGAVDLNSYVRSEMTLRAPSEVGLAVHWLAVDGIQPDVPENPPPPGTGAIEPDGAASAAGGGPYPPDRTVHRVEDDEDLEAAALAASADGALDGDGSSGAAAAAEAGVSVRQLLPRLLSEELRLYFTRITLAVERGTAPQQDAALRSVGRDTGIQELVPFFVRFVGRSIYGNVGRVEYCRTLVRLAGRLVDNPSVHLELHLHQMLPAIITCVVARRLSGGGGGEEAGGAGENHWILREEAAGVLVKACSTFGDQYTTLKARVLRTLCEALSPDMPLTTQYGGIVGITLFGPKAVDAFLLPVATAYWTRWEAALETETDPGRRFEVQQCQRALLDALASFMGSVTVREQSGRVDGTAVADVFGERLIPLRAEPSEYVSSFV